MPGHPQPPPACICCSKMSVFIRKINELCPGKRIICAVFWHNQQKRLQILNSICKLCISCIRSREHNGYLWQRFATPCIKTIAARGQVASFWVSIAKNEKSVLFKALYARSRLKQPHNEIHHTR